MNQGRTRMAAVNVDEARALERLTLNAARMGWWSDAAVYRAQSQTFWVAALIALLEA